MTNLCPQRIPLEKRTEQIMSPNEMYFETQLTKCNSHAKFQGNL